MNDKQPELDVADSAACQLIADTMQPRLDALFDGTGLKPVSLTVMADGPHVPDGPWDPRLLVWLEDYDGAIRGFLTTYSAGDARILADAAAGIGGCADPLRLYEQYERMQGDGDEDGRLERWRAVREQAADAQDAAGRIWDKVDDPAPLFADGPGGRIVMETFVREPGHPERAFLRVDVPDDPDGEEPLADVNGGFPPAQREQMLRLLRQACLHAEDSLHAGQETADHDTEEDDGAMEGGEGS